MNRHLNDSWRGKNIRLPLADLLRQSIYSGLAGYEDVNDAVRLRQDPRFRRIDSRKTWGAESGLDLALGVVRGRSADARREFCRAGRAQPGFAQHGRRHRFAAVGSDRWSPTMLAKIAMLPLPPG